MWKWGLRWKIILLVSLLPLMCCFPLIIINPMRPVGVAPFSGATTGTGGRIRDVQSAGQGGHVIAGTAGYCFGNLHIPGLPDSMLHFLHLKCEIVLKSVICCLVLQVTFSPGSLQERAGSIRPALLLRCRWQSRPVMEPRTMATSLENLSCQVLKHAWICFNTFFIYYLFIYLYA